MGTINYNRNTTYTITHTYQKNGVPSSDGQTLFFTVKDQQSDDSTTDSTAILQKTLAMSGAVTTFTINPEDVGDDIVPGNYFYDFKVKESDGPPKRMYQGDFGTFELTANPTNREE